MSNDQESAPAELPRLNALSESEVIAKYGQPAREQRAESERLWFRNGLFVGIENDKIISYGIFDAATFARMKKAQQARRSEEFSAVQE